MSQTVIRQCDKCGLKEEKTDNLAISSRNATYVSFHHGLGIEAKIPWDIELCVHCREELEKKLHSLASEFFNFVKLGP